MFVQTFENMFPNSCSFSSEIPKKTKQHHNVSIRFHTKEARDVLRSHLDRNKWKEAAINTEQLRSTRWMVGSAPRATQCPPELRKALTVTAHSQVLHLKLVVHTFAEAGRRVRASARGRLRLATDAFEAHADFACLYSATMLEARQLSTWNQEKEDAILKSYFQK